jgi:aerobic carbon-monoxide dehydrogenase medium subunit
VIPAAFEYFRARSIDEALGHLQQYGSDARVLAGGQSLVPAMRFRLARPAVLVDINAIADLGGIHANGGLTIGATARDTEVERATWVREQKWSLLYDVCRVVADPVVRQRATVVGSLCHNDPAGDWTAVALAGGAEVIVRGKEGERTVPIDRFLVDSFTTAVEDGELALAVRFPDPGHRSAGSYQKIERKVGDYATAAAAVQISLDANGGVAHAGIALSAAGPCAVRVAEAERLLVGHEPGADAIRAAADAASRASQPQADLRGSVEYKKHLAGVVVARGLRAALARLGVQG